MITPRTRLQALTLTLAVALALPSLSATAATPSSVPPLTDSDKAAIWSSPADDAPRKLGASRKDLEGRHYLTGDEVNMHLFRPHIEGLGGAYAGVGTDQAYLLMGWQRPELVWVTDYDPWISYLHQAYRVLFEASETPEAWLAHFAKGKASKAARAMIETKLADDPNIKTISWAFHVALPKARRRWSNLKIALRGTDEKTFVNDQETYRYVRDMVLADRVRPLICNLLDSKCFMGLSKTLKDLNIPLRVLYVSNAEGYWTYPQQFRDNMGAQFTDERSVLLRTIPKKKRNKDYHYVVQPFANFVAWLQRADVKRYRDFIPYVRVKDEKDIPVTVFKGEPTAPK